MSLIHVFITLKVPDNIALSARRALKDRLGYTALTDARRCDFWEIAFDSLDESEALETVERWVAKTALFAIPNKHRWRVELARSKHDNGERIRSFFASDASVLVRDREDGAAEAVLEALSRFADAAERPTSLIRGVWWDLTFDAPPEDIRRMTEDLAVARSRSQGLLANPHYQTHTIYYS